MLEVLSRSLYWQTVIGWMASRTHSLKSHKKVVSRYTQIDISSLCNLPSPMININRERTLLEIVRIQVVTIEDVSLLFGLHGSSDALNYIPMTLPEDFHALSNVNLGREKALPASDFSDRSCPGGLER